MIITFYPKTYQTLMKLIRDNHFDIVDYRDAKPVPSSKKIYPFRYELTTKIPSFCHFKLRKR